MITAEGFTIVIPTFREEKNIRELVKRISMVDFSDRHFEVLLVDDNSQDGIIETVRQLSVNYPWLKLIVRQEKKCLSQSILMGFKHAQFPLLITMDADLSHPPEKIPELLAAIDNPQVDYVIGSRYIMGGSCDQAWPLRRKFTSQFSAFLANTLIFSHVRIKDPLSGFCVIRKRTLELADPLRPIGWKIGLELMVKCRCRNIVEIPIDFSERNLGVSKLNLKIGFNYFRHIIACFGINLNINVNKARKKGRISKYHCTFERK